MAKKRHFRSRCVGGSFIFAIIICFFSGLLFAEEQSSNSSPAPAPRYRVFALKNIPGVQGKEFLENVGIGTVSLLPANPNTMLVTASQADLVKVTSILELIDSKTEYTYGVICPAEELSAMPTSKQLEKAIGSIAVGTLFDPPPSSAPVKAIVDIHNDKVVAIAPVSEYDKIAVAVMQFGKTAVQGVKAAEANEAKAIPDEFGVLLEPEMVVVPPQKALEPNKAVETKKGTEAKKENNSGEDFFGKLMNKLDEAEKAEAEKQTAEKFAKAKQRYEATKAREISEADVPAAKVEKPKEAAVAAESSAAEKPTGGAVKISYEPEPNLPAADETLDLNLPESLEIVQLLTLVGDYMHLDYMYDPSKVTGAVTLKLRGPIKVKELYPLVESVLKFKGFVMTRKGNLVTIVPMGEALDIDPALLKEDGKVRYGDVIVTKFFNLQYLSTDNAKNLLDGMKLSVNITPIPETGTLIVTGYTYRMERIDEILSIIDKPGPPKQFRFRALKYTMAETLAPKVKSLVEQLGEISITVGVSTAPTPAPMPARRRPQPARAQPPVAEGGRPSVYLDADERTNRILMIGFEEQLNTVEELIDSLDIAKQDLRAIRLYDIQHVGAEEVKNKLIELGIIGGEVQAGAYRTTQPTRITRQQQQPQPAAGVQPEGATVSVTEQPIVVIIESTNSLLVNATPEQHDQIASIISYVDTETLEHAVPYEIYYLENQDPKDLAEVLTKLIQETVKDKEGKVESVVKKTEEEIVIVPDENTFAIIVYASKKNQEWIKKLITSLDRRRPQVLIDCTLVEIRREDTFEYDLNIVAAGTGATAEVTKNVILPPITGTKTPPFNNKYEVASHPSDTDTQGSVFYSDSRIQALLKAIQTKDYGRVLAKPKVLVDDGSEGTISTTDETTYQKQTVQITGTDNQPLTTTDFVAVTAKIELKITPHISEGELLRLEVLMLRDDFLNRPGGNLAAPPDKTTSQVQTTVFVPDGKTIILGGLVKLNQQKGGSKVPILGDLPIVGGLFRNVTDSDTESKLYVFLKANIVRPSVELQDLQAISQSHRDAFEEGETEFQKTEDFPCIKPKLMEPAKVLDEL